MNPYRKAAAFLIQLVACAFVLFGALPLGMNYFAHRQHKPVSGIGWLVFEVISLLVGLVLLLKSGSIARKLTEDFEE